MSTFFLKQFIYICMSVQDDSNYIRKIFGEIKTSQGLRIAYEHMTRKRNFNPLRVE